jgi:uncharacterized membrane protein
MEISDLTLHLLIGPLMLLFSIIFILFPSKKINILYGHRTKMSMLNLDTWKFANTNSSKIMFLVSILTCAIQIGGIFLDFENDDIILYSTIFLVAGLIGGALLVEKKLKELFDNQGNRK